jgi:hypothetical protein
MKKTTIPRPAKTSYSVLKQIVQWIPPGLPDRLAREAGADIRKFSCTSHVAAPALWATEPVGQSERNLRRRPAA